MNKFVQNLIWRPSGYRSSAHLLGMFDAIEIKLEDDVLVITIKPGGEASKQIRKEFGIEYFNL